MSQTTAVQAPADVASTSFDELVSRLDVLRDHPNTRFAGVGRAAASTDPGPTAEQVRAIAFERAEAEHDRAQAVTRP
jgi:hypothetical protein